MIDAVCGACAVVHEMCNLILNESV